MIILDEGQRIKNWEAKTTQMMKSLRSRFALVLSGTPLENRLDDLFSVVEFVDDRRLGPSFRFFNTHRIVDEKGKPHWSYNWEFGPALLIRNEIKGPAESGTLFDLNEFEKVDDPTTTSAAMVNVNIKENHDAWVILNPFEGPV